MRPEPTSLRIALLTYRGNPRSGGQGVYVANLSGALAALGHRVTVFSGPPYAEVPEGVELVEVPSLDLYRADDPFRVPRRDEFRDWIDALEFGAMCTAAFPEPLTFSLRMARQFRRESLEFDVVHDNQTLGYGLLDVARRVPLVTTIHHPISIDRRHELAAARHWKRRLSLTRWYAFTRMQARVARHSQRVVAVSEAAVGDIVREFGVDRSRVSVVPNGVDTELFRPVGTLRDDRTIFCLCSSHLPVKGLIYLIEAVAKLRTESDVRLVLAGAGSEGRAVKAAIDRFGIGDGVRIEGPVDALRLVDLFSTCTIAVVPSLYEGFSLPAVEAMSCQAPLVATSAGALPEVVGTDGAGALLVPPGDAHALAAGIKELLDDPARRAAMGKAGRQRVLDRFTWHNAASSMVDVYKDAMSC
jgi:glycosyltransferase involved in cell wall biosynthesis